MEPQKHNRSGQPSSSATGNHVI